MATDKSNKHINATGRGKLVVSATDWEMGQEGITVKQTGFWSKKKRLIRFDEIKSVSDPREEYGDTVIIELKTGKKFSLKEMKSGTASKFRSIVEQAPIRFLLESTTGFEDFREGLISLQDKTDIDARHLVNAIISKAIQVRASDVHLESHKDVFRTRFRVDGMFYDGGEFTPKWARRIISRIKVASELVVYRKDIPQEGRIPFTLGENPVDVRVSIVPTVAGEKAVLRIFDSERAKFMLSKLNFHDDIENRLRELILRPGGVILLTGPASSGKTTTMYACLKEIAQVKKETTNIVSIEDPVEYQLGIIQQMQTDPKKGLTFAKALSAMLRQDPEVIMVGEIRDTETAKTCLQAGLTGHLVLSTIHCGRAHIVPLRLLDMGIEPFQISSALKGCLALRLVRKNCPECREKFELSKPVMKMLKPFLKDFNGPYQRGKGCQKCLGIGTFGRIPVAELIIIDEAIRKTLSSRCTPKKLETVIRKSGDYFSIMDNGIELIKSGDLNPEELVRVLEVD